MAGDQRSAWPLTLARSGPFGGPVKEGVGWVVLLDVGGVQGSVPPWQVRFLIGSEASWRLDSSRYCPATSERPGAERPGQDRVRLAAVLCCLSNAIATLLHSVHLCMASTQPWATSAVIVTRGENCSGWEHQLIIKNGKGQNVQDQFDIPTILLPIISSGFKGPFIYPESASFFPSYSSFHLWSKN